MVNWPTVARPTALGGLGVLDLKLFGYAVQTRWLWLQKTDNDWAWAELPIQADPVVLAFSEHQRPLLLAADELRFSGSTTG